MNIAKGVSVGPYEILSPIGAGGMGEVWRARDRRIGRDVAMKVLADSFGAGNETVRRFEQEARAAGALNHPGLVTIFDVGTNDGSPYIVMELLDGETIRDAIDRAAPAPLPLRKTIEYAMQIAEALAVAHEKGIIHRDLKPENLFITTDRRVKILDFGLAKLAEATDSDGKPRTGRHLTSAGIVVGTPGYMSPEQVRALPLDHRTDIFSLGSVIYEMLSGQTAFERDSAIETMHAVMSIEPVPLATLVPDIPPALDAIVRHCMEKDPRERFQSARDLAFQLRMLPELQAGVTDTRRVAQVPRRRLLPWRTAAAALAAAAVIAAGAFAVRRYRTGAGAAVEVPARTFQQLTSADGVELFPTLAPDGKTFAYVSSQSGNRDIYVQRVDGRSAIDITADSPDDDSEPAFSRDGSQIAFRSERDGGGIFVMGVTGESVRRLTDFGHNPSWSPDGRRLVISTAGTEMQPHVHNVSGALWLVDTRSGAKRLLVHGARGVGADGDAIQPDWSPHGSRIAFWGLSGNGQRDLWTIAPDAPDTARSVTRLTSDAALDWNPVWSPDGRQLYFGSNRDGTLNLWRMDVDEESGEAGGTPEPVSLPAAVSGNFTFSQDGQLAFTTITRSSRLLALPFDAAAGTAGEPRPLFGGSQEIFSFDSSPDGRSIAFTTSGGAQEDLFVANADGSRVRQLTNDAARDRGVVWSPDGKTLYFYSNRDRVYHIWSVRADGSGLTRITDDRDLARVKGIAFSAPYVSPDGRTLTAGSDQTAVLIHLDRPLGQRVEALSSAIIGGRWSPDGTQLVGRGRDTTTGRTRGMAIYSLGTKKLDQFSDDGVWPQWLPDGKHIVFFDKDTIGTIDLASRRITKSAFALPPGVQLAGAAAPRLSRDGTTLYLRQTLEQGDIWMARFATP